MNREDAEEFTQSLGQIVGGSFRQIELADRLGVPKALGYKKVRDWVNECLGGYIRHEKETRQKAAIELKANGHSNCAIAAYLGVDESTIRNDLRSGNPEYAGIENNGLDGTASGFPEPARRPTPKPPDGQFSVILADPPWRYEFSPTDSRQIEKQYQTMDVDDICRLGGTMPFAQNAVLFLWATAPKLLEAFAVLKAWSFDYVTHAVWDKEIIGMGYWFRGQHELLLVATRGDFPPPAEDLRVPSVIHGRRSKHSEKPEAAYRLIEAAYPELAEKERLEMFARDRREGWTSWGNEV